MSPGKTNENEIYLVGDWEKLKLLLWKNWVLQRNQKVQFLVTLLIPIIFILLFVLMRIASEIDRVPAQRYPPLPLDNLTALMEMGILENNGQKPNLCFTPDTPENAAILKTAASFLMLGDSRPYDSAIKMEKDLLKQNFLAGVEFEEKNGRAEGSKYPSNLTYSLRFPSELRSSPPWYTITWQTTRLFVRYDVIGPRNPSSPDGGIPVGYLGEGFLSLQHALTLSWLSQTTGKSMSEFPRVVFQRFPFRAFTSDQMLFLMRALLPFLIMLSFMYPCSVVASSVTTEKELQLKEVMKMIGVDNWLHWIAWFLKSYLVLLLIVMLYVLVVKLQFGNSVSVFTFSEWLPILAFLHSYVTASICFCFMLAGLFSKASTASVVTCILWYASYIPFTFIIRYYDSISLGGKLMIALLCPNSALGLGLNLIMEFEGTGMGATWISMFHPVNLDDDTTLFYIIMTLTLSAILYLTICLYVEQVFPGSYGIARKWNFFLRRDFWCGSQDTSSPRRKGGLDPGKRVVGVELMNLQKTFGKFKAVKGLDLKMYRDEITVLLGHNGAGKSTTLLMLTGMIPPTAGTALINGYDIRTQLSMARQSLGICPQNNVLFMKMSVRDHIKFFSKLKGVRGSEAVDKEISKYVGILSLEAKSHVAAERLSGGMKRKLCLCCAMCGNARVVLCDEPSSGIDAAGRKSLWELLQAEKRGRTVLLTTHYMDEADVLGDRIAILAEGKIQCQGTSFNLKKQYGTGYQLVCIMLAGCDVNAVTQLINRHLPNLLPEREMGTELTYRLPHSETKKFADLLADLDGNSAKLKLSGYGLSVATLEDVFMAVNQEKRVRGGQDKNDKSPDFQTLVFDNRTRENRPFIRCLMGFQALLLKKVMMTVRNYALTLIQILLPVFLLALTTFITMGITILPENPPMQISPFQYTSSYVVMKDNSTTDQLSPLAKAYAKHMEHYGKRSTLLRTGHRSVENYILGLDKSWDYRLDYALVAGVTIGAKTSTVWLNNKPLHTAPLTLNLFHNAMARHYLSQEAGTYVTNKPLPYKKDTRNQRDSDPMSLRFQIALNLTLCMCFVTALFSIPIIKEQETRAKLLQFLSGVNAFAFWTTMLLWDFLIFMISAFLTILTLAAFREPGIASVTELGLYYAILLIFGFAGLCVSYVMANWFTNAATGFIRIAMFNLGTGCGLYMVNIGLQAYKWEKHIWFFRVFPHFCLANAVDNLYMGFIARRKCSESSGSSSSCEIPGYFAWKSTGVLPEVVYLIIVEIALFIFLIISDANLLNALRKLCQSPKKRSSGGSSTENADVTEERTLVRDLISSRRKDIPLLVDNIRKEYKKKLAVKGVSFHVANAECFGLLGINGAGKTSVFKMLTGDTTITSGDAYINGLNLTTQMRKVRHKIGYCPQFDSLFEDLTGRQNLRFYCLLRGIQQRYIAEVSWTLALAFGFQNHLDKRSKVYSGGNKRKLSTAIAILGNPSVVFLDEPTSGMDPGARRQLWQIMTLIRKAGKSLVLTSHSMDECEALCTSLTIMVDGEFKCIGATQSLKNQYAKGLVLKIKVDSNEERKKGKKKEKKKKNNFFYSLVKSSESSSSSSSEEKKDKKKKKKNVKSSASSSSSSSEEKKDKKKEKKNLHIFSSSSSSSSSSPIISETDTTSDEISETGSFEKKPVSEKEYSDRISDVKAFIRDKFPKAELKDEYNGLLTYSLPQTQKLSEVFRIIEDNKKKLFIEDYMISQTRLEEIFLDFALNCEHREADVGREKCCGCYC